MKSTTSLLAIGISSIGHSALAQGNGTFQCTICGEGFQVGNPEAVVSIPAFEEGVLGQDRTCSELQAAGDLGQITEADCSLLSPLVLDPCQCEALVDNAVPTSAPVSGMQPSGCYDDLNVIANMEWSLNETDTETQRVYTLCPGTTFVMGRGDPNNPGVYLGGFDPIYPRKNVHYKCGPDGALEDECILTDGDFSIVSFGFDQVIENVLFEGIIFEKTFRGGMLFAEAGYVTFKDCVIRDMQNFGVMLSLFDSPFVRRLKQDGLTGNRHLDFANLMNLYERGDIEDADPGRDLQESTSDVLTTLTISMISSSFEGNQAVPPSRFARPGLVTMSSPDNILILEDVTFRNNLFGDEEQPVGYALQTPGPLTMKNCCFIDNDFKRNAPVITLGAPEVVAVNNFGTFDDNLTCAFLGDFQDEPSLEAIANYTCFGYDSDICTADVETMAPEPTPAPVESTRQPVFRVTEQPVRTKAPVASIDETSVDGSAGSTLSYIVSSSVLGVVAMLLV